MKYEEALEFSKKHIERLRESGSISGFGHDVDQLVILPHELKAFGTALQMLKNPNSYDNNFKTLLDRSGSTDGGVSVYVYNNQHHTYYPLFNYIIDTEFQQKDFWFRLYGERLRTNTVLLSRQFKVDHDYILSLIDKLPDDDEKNKRFHSINFPKDDPRRAYLIDIDGFYWLIGQLNETASPAYKKYLEHYEHKKQYR